MKHIEWSSEKNHWLKDERDIDFEAILYHLTHGDILDIIEHPNPEKYPNQKIFILNVENYAWLVPFIENHESIFLKTAIPSRKMTKRYLGEPL